MPPLCVQRLKIHGPNDRGKTRKESMMAAQRNAPRYIRAAAATALRNPRSARHDGRAHPSGYGLRGLLIAAPVSLALWAAIGVVVRALI
jgi:hypothetical protein